MELSEQQAKSGVDVVKRKIWKRVSNIIAIAAKPEEDRTEDEKLILEKVNNFERPDNLPFKSFSEWMEGQR
ncbi:hypothetical protein [Microbulbifer taiwanensis]|uniref:Uncharacterized protein n=1 Tax=Microbulbifer taiwanensis TaxID=986746 RepID=A0ABW1YRJ5_9GAMM|nr:hypothetical protein [Microbulbifer taiwanensis]